MAAGNLSYYLYDKMGVRDDKVVIEQGYFMSPPSKSEIIVKLNHQGERLNNIMAGGRAKVMQEIEVELD